MHLRAIISRTAFVALALTLAACKKEQPAAATPAPGEAAKPPAAKALKIGIVTDVGGRGDQSFNDSALRGLELWAAGRKYEGGGYKDATQADIDATLSPELKARTPAITPLPVSPIVLQSKVQEDYEPNLQLLVDQGAQLVIGVGYMLENAIETVARRNPDAKFLLIDSPLLDSKGNPFTLPNVRTISFREEQGSFLVGGLAGLVTKTNKLGFVGGIEVPLIKKFEAGYRAGAATVNPDATVFVNYTGTFDNVSAGKQVAQDLIAKGADVLFHAAGSDGLGVIQAVKEAHAGGKRVYAIGVDSDQHFLAPQALLTSMVKGVDLAVYDTTRDLVEGRWSAGDQQLGLKENAVGYAPVRVELEKKDELIGKVEALRQRIIAGELKVPANTTELGAFKATP